MHTSTFPNTTVVLLGQSTRSVAAHYHKATLIRTSQGPMPQPGQPQSCLVSQPSNSLSSSSASLLPLLTFYGLFTFLCAHQRQSCQMLGLKMRPSNLFSPNACGPRQTLFLQARLLVVDAKHRLTAQQALQHPWMQVRVTPPHFGPMSMHCVLS